MQTPSSEGSTHVTSGTAAASGTVLRLTSASAHKPQTSDDMHINLVMKMGFPRKTIELAVHTLRKLKKN